MASGMLGAIVDHLNAGVDDLSSILEDSSVDKELGAHEITIDEAFEQKYFHSNPLSCETSLTMHMFPDNQFCLHAATSRLSSTRHVSGRLEQFPLPKLCARIWKLHRHSR
jgi:hypothetical protein